MATNELVLRRIDLFIEFWNTSVSRYCGIRPVAGFSAAKPAVPKCSLQAASLFHAAPPPIRVFARMASLVFPDQPLPHMFGMARSVFFPKVHSPSISNTSNRALHLSPFFLPWCFISFEKKRSIAFRGSFTLPPFPSLWKETCSVLACTLWVERSELTFEISTAWLCSRPHRKQQRYRTWSSTHSRNLHLQPFCIIVIHGVPEAYRSRSAHRIVGNLPLIPVRSLRHSTMRNFNIPRRLHDIPW